MKTKLHVVELIHKWKDKFAAGLCPLFLDNFKNNGEKQKQQVITYNGSFWFSRTRRSGHS